MGLLKNVWKIASVFAAILIPILIYVFLWEWKTQESQQPITFQEHDLSDHPLYSNYVFGDSSDVIDVGMQPMWLPTSIITEVMQRDLLLKNGLSGLGKEIRFHSFLKGADVNYFLGKGDLEIGIGGDMPAIIASATFEVMIISMMQKGFVSIVSDKYQMMKDLRGKRIGYPYGSIAHYALLRALSADGLSEEDVNMIPYEVHQLPDAMKHGEIHVFSAWEPTPTAALDRFNDFVAIHKSLSTGYMYCSADFANGYPELLREILASQIRSLVWLSKDLKNLLRASTWAKRSAETFGNVNTVLTSKQYADIASQDLLGLSISPNIPRRDLAEGGRVYEEFLFLKNIGKIPEYVKWEKVKNSFNLEIIDEILSNSDGYRIYNYDVKYD